MTENREKLIDNLPIDDAILILKEEHRRRADGYTTYLANGGKYNPVEELSLAALEMAISALEQTKWIPVTERLPEPYVSVLALRQKFDDGGCFQKVEHILPVYGGGFAWFMDMSSWKSKVTHWMSLPEMPEEA